MNKEISSILLLVVIGFAIVCLCNTKTISGMANVSPRETESFQSESLKSETASATDTASASDIESVAETTATASSILSVLSPIKSESKLKAFNSEIEQPSGRIKSKLVKSIKNKAVVKLNRDANTTVSKKDIKSILNSSCGSNLPGAGITSDIAGIPSGSSFGANLKNAFNSPIPKGTKTDNVEFKNKKNNKKYNHKDYLPDKKQVKKWWDTDFTTAQYKVNKDSNLLPVMKFVQGADTVAGTLRNASWDTRGPGPKNPRLDVGIWNLSTIEPDTNRKPLC